jgi:transcriptional regulator GlxA family with amidase domain
MQSEPPRPKEALILALPETAGSALYGMVDVLGATGTLWRQLVGEPAGEPLLRPRIVAPGSAPFRCGNGIPVCPELAVGDDPAGEIVVLPELWLAPDDALEGRYPEVLDWVRRRWRAGSHLYSACTGSVLLAATGLLDGRRATSHWAYQELFRTRFAAVDFDPGPSLCFADPAGRIVTAGGTTSWHDLAIHIVARHCGPGEALRIAQVYLLKWHAEGQRPYASLVRRQPHADALVRRAEDWLARHFREPHAVAGVVAACGVPERTLKRRFKAATGAALIDHVQNLRVEAAKRLLEAEAPAAEAVAAAVGYENAAFFRRLFKRATGLAPGQYRRMFRPLAAAGHVPAAEPGGAATAGRT